MNTERMTPFDVRVVKHAALADPARLRIIDLLTLGDYSPTELQIELGIPSNLLSHHLRTLEEADLVTRRRSEADKRRSYIRLIEGGLDGLVPTLAQPTRRVLFVCTHNSARSQLATALWQQASNIPATSAGTHPAERIAAGAITVARQHGLNLDQLEPRHLDSVAATGDFIVTVCDNAHEELPGLGGIHWSISDPLRSNTPEAFQHAFDDINRRITHLAPRLHAA